MSITVGVNSWVTIAEADAYLADKFGASGWALLSDSTKSELLITAFRWIRSTPGLDIAKTATAEDVKSAQIECAWYVNIYSEGHEKRNHLYSSGVRQFKVTQYEEWLEKATLPSIVDDLLSGYYTNSQTAFPLVNRDLP